MQLLANSGKQSIYMQVPISALFLHKHSCYLIHVKQRVNNAITGCLFPGLSPCERRYNIFSVQDLCIVPFSMYVSVYVLVVLQCK